MARRLLVLFGLLLVLGCPSAAAASKGTASVSESTPRGTLRTSQAAHLVFALPASRWVRATDDSGAPTPGVYERRSIIAGKPCNVVLYVDGRGQSTRPAALTPGRLPIDSVRFGTQGAYHWLTARSTGEPGPAAPSPYGSAYRRAASSAKWNFVRITASIGFVEPTTSACHRSGARVDLRPLVTTFRVTPGALD